MGVLGVVRFLMSEVPLYLLTVGCSGEVARQGMQLHTVNSTYQQGIRTGMNAASVGMYAWRPCWYVRGQQDLALSPHSPWRMIR